MRTIVLTGGTAGFGAVVAERLTRSGDVRLILGTPRRGEAAHSAEPSRALWNDSAMLVGLPE
ncbi:Rossmann-fold NAD(P)-binding domain-containing protein [Nonomuraea gerenzanensis]|uniref:Uncharacterized protein n=1 Tax=Nonomuraea gerenzanensis TaxID=93944 RepID=A0A1M4EAE7_9ACTN|nr:hypothetical protein [Nonomuraea gerenzanensis]UBU18084.1 hypothetical protein LCN96_24575 [Nonomuraea gerenzanensis]SBO95891.1 hypothetical protein BN4615_P5407 [Nonomuraea gerenzanensis]